MTKRTRTLLFAILAILFFVVTPLTIFYSLGWRFDFRYQKIIKTGVLYFQVWPESSQIYINGKLAKKTDFFFGTALVQNLLPKYYDIEIKKEGFQTWKKTLPIFEKLATEVRGVVLVPEKPVFNLISQNILNYFVSPDENKIILQEKTPTGLASDWSLKILDLATNIESPLIDSQDIAKNYLNLKNGTLELTNIVFSSDSQFAFLEVKTKTSPAHFVIDLSQNPAVLTFLEMPELNADQTIFNPTDRNTLLALEESKIIQINLPQKINYEVTSQTILENIAAISSQGNNFYYLDSSGNFFKTDFSLANPQKINKTPLPMTIGAKYQILGTYPNLLVKENDALYFLNPDSQNFEKILDSVPNLVVSPNSKKIAVFDGKKISILYLLEQTSQPQKKAGQESLLTSFGDDIKNVFWLTNNYLIVETGRQIKIVEIDDRDQINVFTLGEFDNPKIFFGQDSKKLFILDDENLYLSERLSP